MLKWKFAFLSLVVLGGTAWAADPWVNPREVCRLAKQVEVRAAGFCEIGQGGGTGMHPFLQDGRRLARDADQFRDKVDRGAPYQSVIAEYRQLQASYLRMNDTFEKSHKLNQKWEVRYRWLSLSYAFHELDWAMTQGNGSIAVTLPDRPETPGPGPGRPGQGPGGNPGNRPGPRPGQND